MTSILSLVLDVTAHRQAEVQTRNLLDMGDRDRAILLSILEDERRIEEALKLESQANAAVAELAAALIQPTTMDEISDIVLRHAKILTGSKYGRVGFVDPDLPETDGAREETRVSRDFNRLCKMLLTNRVAILANDPAGDARIAEWSRGASPFKRILSVPAVIEGTPVGQISLANPERDYTESDLAILGRLASLYAIAVNRARSEQALAQSQQTVQAVIETAPSLILLVNQEGRILLANKTVERLTGHRQEEIMGRIAGEIGLPSEWVGAVRSGLNREDVERLRQARENPLRACSGEDRTIEWRCTPLDSHKFGRCLLAIGVDVTERKLDHRNLEDTNMRLSEALDRLKTAQEKSATQERLRALGQLASGIAHDLNNTLSPILGFSDLLVSSAAHREKPDELLNYLRMIKMAAKDAAEVVRRLKEFYRPRSSTDEFTSIRVEELVTEAVSLTRPRWRDEVQASGIHVLMVTDLPAVPGIMGNPSELRECLANLILNAVDAMPQGGTLTASCSSDAGTVVVKVKDTGVGMASEVRARCLEPFFTTKGERGSGLGLSLVYGTITRHGGTVVIESAPGEGTTVSLHFPAASEAWRPSVAGDLREGRLDRQIHVLVVDDEDMIREMVGEFLKNDGHTVVTAEGGETAIAKMRDGKFDLVITDRSMPRMNGDQLAAAINGMCPDVPIIMMSGFGDMMKSVGEKPDHVDHVVGKPITLVELREAVAKVMAR
jgi:PAS domain S-box-containing protein